MKKIDDLLMFLLFVFGIFPILNNFIPEWYEKMAQFLYLNNGIGIIDLILILMMLLTIYRYLTEQYQDLQNLGVMGLIITFSVWLMVEIIRNLNQYKLSALGEFRFRYLILVLPIYIALNFNNPEARKKLSRYLIIIVTIEFQEYLRKLGMDQDKDVLRESVWIMSQMLMELEVQKPTGAAKHERTPECKTQRNGYQERIRETRVGEIRLHIPKLRTGSYFPSLLEPRRRTEQALLAHAKETSLNSPGEKCILG